MGKRTGLFLLILLLLSGCAAPRPDAMEEALAFRAQAQSHACSFAAELTADYGAHTYTFTLDCAATPEGHLSFTVTAPESISGITGEIAADGGKLTFDGLALGFPLLAEGKLSPAAAPHTILRSWQTGYITACGREGDTLRLTVDTSFEEKPLTVETWLDAEKRIPLSAEICYNGQAVLSAAISDFHFE